MKKKMTQEQRLDTLVEAFKADSVQYKDLQTPADTEGKRRILRSLMNIRMPKKLDDSVLTVQDEYLRERILENGIVTLSEIPVIRNGTRRCWAASSRCTPALTTASTPLPESSFEQSAAGR